MQTTSTQERNTMKKALLTFIAIGSATIATVIAFASPASAEVIELEPQVEIAVIPELEVDEVLCPDCDPILPPVDPDPIVPTVTICIEINPGDCDLDPIIIDPINLIDPVDPKEEEDDPEEDGDESTEEIVEENVELGIEEDGDESTEEIVEENVDAPAETEEIAITDEAPEEENQDTGDELPKTGVDIFHILLIALALLVAGFLLLASSKIKAAEKVVA
jgi:LPXTG-motif cell wall-anchored protein